MELLIQMQLYSRYMVSERIYIQTDNNWVIGIVEDTLYLQICFQITDPIRVSNIKWMKEQIPEIFIDKNIPNKKTLSI